MQNNYKIFMNKYIFLNQPLLRVSEIKNDFNSESALFGALKRLEDSNKIKKIKGGLYATINPLNNDIFVNRYELACSLYENCYIAYHTALEFYGLATQVYSDVHIVAYKRYSSMIIENLEFQFYKVPFNGGVVEYNNVSKIRVTDLERTIVDCLDKTLLCGGLEEVYQALLMIKNADENKLLDYLEKYNKKILYKKAGYLFSLIKPKYLTKKFYNTCVKKISSFNDDIRENKKSDFVYDKKWRIYAPKNII